LDHDPDFERVRRAFLCQGEGDRVPLVELGIDKEIKERFLGHAVDTLEQDIEFWARAGYDYIILSAGIRSMMGPDHEQVGIRGVKEDISSQYSVNGAGPSSRAWAREGKGLIASRHDFDSFEWPETGDFDWSSFENAHKSLPPGMKAIAAIGYVFLPTWQLMGLETFCLALHDDEELVARVFARVVEIQRESFLRAIEYDCVGAVWMPDDFAYAEGLFINPKYFRKYVFPFYKEAGRICKERGLPYILHSDGVLDEIMGDIIDCGFNAIQPIEPKAMDIRQLKRDLAGRVCLIGNLDLGGVLTMGTPEEVRECTKDLIRDLAPGGGYCVGSSNSVTEYVPMANFNAMREAVFEFGVYPINISA
jgi:uroporphyrinogen decarboxylase